MSPSRFELPDTLSTMEFASSTGKVPRRDGPIKDLLDYFNSHFVRIETVDGKEALIVKSGHFLCLTPAFPVTKIIQTVDFS